MSMQERPTSGLRSELRLDNLSDDVTMLDQEAMEIMQDESEDHKQSSAKDKSFGLTEGGHGGFTRRMANPPPTFDPEQSLGDISVIEGISLDAAQAGAYLDNLLNLDDPGIDTSSLLQKATHGEEEVPVERLDDYASVCSQIEPAMVPTAQACELIHATSHMTDATIQTDDVAQVYCDMAVQAQVPSEFAVESSLTVQVLLYTTYGRRQFRKTATTFHHQRLPNSKQTVRRFQIPTSPA